MVYLYYISCLRYTILVGDSRFVPCLFVFRFLCLFVILLLQKAASKWFRTVRCARGVKEINRKCQKHTMNPYGTLDEKKTNLEYK